MTDPYGNQASEFGGIEGTIAPPPHKLTPIEEARIMRRVRDDNVDDMASAREREVTGDVP